MKFLISNYGSAWDTEPFYFNAGLSIIGESSKLFNIQDNSVYDEFDSFKPNVFITHLNHLTRDIIHYILSNDKISLLINTNNSDVSNLDKLANSLSEKNISAIFFGEHDLKIHGVSYVRILPSADIFLNSGDIKYSIQKLIFVNDEEDIIELDGTYHYTSTNENLINKVDFILPMNMLNTLFLNYKEIVFKDRSYIGSQVSFNAIYSGSKVVFDTKNTEDLEKINHIFKGNKLLSSTKNQHTCLHRIKSLLSQLNCKDIIDKLEREIKKI